MFLNDKIQFPLTKEKLISINISIGAYTSFVSAIIDLAKNRTPSYICVANVHMLVEAYNDLAFQDVVNQSTICTPDGMPLVWGLKLINAKKQERVAGMDLLPDLLKQAELQNITVYFYGGSLEMLRLTENYVSTNYPKLKIAGLHSPPFRSLTKQEEDEDAIRINQSGASIVLVALGCPKQEKWMAKMNTRLSMPTIGIGGALPVLIGMQSRAPRFIQKLGLEWFYRLIQEPKRLFKRYAVTNSIFLWLLFKNYISK